jgi:ribosomal protein S18 acetylase RimI-like enzyme
MTTSPLGNIHFPDLTHQSPEFDAAYAVISRDIPPAYLETREFLKNRFRVRDQGPESAQEKVLLQNGYTLHLIAATVDRTVVGAIYGHLISLRESRGIGFITYISVLPEYRRSGFGTRLVEELKKKVNRDAIQATGKPIVGMVFEIEDEGKDAIKGLVRRHHGWPLDIEYLQPALRVEYQPERMRLWLQSFEPGITSIEEASRTKFQTAFIVSLVRNLLVKEYVGPEMKGFDLNSKPYTAFLDSIKNRKNVGFAIGVKN